MGHSHSHDKTGADHWTKISAVGELFSSLISDSYFYGSSADIFLKLLTLEIQDVGIGLSWYGVGIGCSVALLSAAGAAYCHSILNTHYQEEEEEPADMTEAKSILVDEDDELKPSKPAKTVSLTWPQRIALAGDFISHTGDKAGPITFVSSLTTEKLALPAYVKPLSHCAATLFGAFASVADVRTCRKSMLEFNRHHQEEEEREWEYSVV